MIKRQTSLKWLRLGIGFLLFAALSLVAAEGEDPIPIDRSTIPSPAIQPSVTTKLEILYLTSLEAIYPELKTLAPKVRVQLRALRMRPDFRGSQLFNIERHMGKGLSAVERLIQLEQSPVISPLRARLLVDDLRRQVKGLREDQSLLITQLSAVDHQQTNEQVGIASTLTAKDHELLDPLADYIELLAKALEISQDTYPK